MIKNTTRKKPEKPDRRSRLRRILDWNLPGSHAMFRSDRSPIVWLMPELKQFDTPKHRADAFEKATYRALTRNARYWLLMIGCMAVVVVFVYFRTYLIRRSYAPFFAFSQGFVAVGAALLPLIVFRRRIRRDLRRQLFEQGRPICIPCGYNLTGNNSGRCPECGWQIDRSDGPEAAPDHDDPAGANKTELEAGVGRHGP